MNSIKKIFRLLVIAFVALGTIYACEDFLSQSPQGTLGASELANKDGVEGNLIATYSMLDGDGNFGDLTGVAASNWVWGSVASDNAYKGSEPGDAGQVSEVELYQWSTGGVDIILNDKFNSLYDAINRANATISLLNSVEGISESERQRIEGEARFLRAHYHFEAWKMWGNIPYYTQEAENYRKPNTGVDPIARILEDLDAAIELLPTTQDEPGRVTEWTAKAYKGRVQVYTGNYSDALSTLREVEQDGPYYLEDNFHQVFSANHASQGETILAYQASVNDGDPTGRNGNWGDRLNFPHAGSPFGCCGFHQPSQNLVNAFQVDGDGLPLPLSQPDSWNDSNTSPDASSPVDPRLDWTVGRDGVPYLDYGVHNSNWIRDRAWAGQYSPKKTIPESSAEATSSVGWASYQLHNQNLHLYRYADLLLLLAEAEVEAGDLGNARELVNRVRERAAAAAQGPIDNIEVPIDDSSITWADYEVAEYPVTSSAFANQENAREAVQMERRLELAMEGHRLFDLRRWGRAQQVLNDFLDVEETRREYIGGHQDYADRHNLYPLPSVQIELSTVDGEPQLQQNPGW
ncbi:RagB/SusD family nutrient uptake outer membrane protein [Aliifodinibius sp. S!AR15-10]|uniref:RagB/SusD family nutrient uptake outer membrane protein n=1 Tax=Aliifodinibius sp. S!AR15-10 TaxID=2950437 RepID=UPI00286704B3|nr:RagB/SusD family nutrient uptake outer membrane protein [Aliifodinibius sp. S!AR15-10]MDR8393071.1 RagB/SusD family nutrient uptake outer membrane protein [Aliifodinibius sp. S!AR15-10]